MWPLDWKTGEQEPVAAWTQEEKVHAIVQLSDAERGREVFTDYLIEDGKVYWADLDDSEDDDDHETRTKLKVYSSINEFLRERDCHLKMLADLRWPRPKKVAYQQ